MARPGRVLTDVARPEGLEAGRLPGSRRAAEQIRQRGFSLPEILVALAITAMALVASATFLAAHARATRRLEVHERLLRSVELAVESVRGRVFPLEPGLFDPAREVEPAIDDLPVAVIDVRKAEIAGLYHVDVTARGEVDGAPVEVRLETMVWRP